MNQKTKKPFDSVGTAAYEAAILRLMQDNGGCRTSAEVALQGMLLVPANRLRSLVARKAWSNPRHYDAAVEAVALKSV